jgi:hypothetical protein
MVAIDRIQLAFAPGMLGEQHDADRCPRRGDWGKCGFRVVHVGLLKASQSEAGYAGTLSVYCL